MTFLQELVTLYEKTKKLPLKKAAKKTYHRDYEKTKNKPYRRYHPEMQKENQEIFTEGFFDYLKGVSKHIGQDYYNKVSDKGRGLATKIQKMHSAGVLSSERGNWEAKKKHLM
jgi:hypothetical protein